MTFYYTIDIILGGLKEWAFTLVTVEIGDLRQLVEGETPEIISMDITIEDRTFHGFAFCTNYIQLNNCKHCGAVEYKYRFQGTGELEEVI